MPKKKKNELEVGTLNDIPVESFISTGFPEVDAICGGGFPRKRVTEIWGLPGTGKSHLLAKCMAAIDGKVLYVDSEFALNKDRLKALGVKMDKVDYLANSQLEKVTEHILEHLNEYDLIIIDTLAKLTPMTIEENEVGANAIGLFARQVSHFEAKLRPKLYASNTAVVAINQARANFGMGMAETKPASTFAWKHTIDLDLKLSRGANNKQYKQTDGVRKEVGHIVTVKIEKNKMGAPGLTATFPVEYYTSSNDSAV